MALTVAGLIRDRADDDNVGLLFEDSSWSWRQFAAACSARAALFREHSVPDRPLHVGVLLDNVPEYLFLIGAAAFTGDTVVGVNPTRRGAELAADLAHVDVDIVVTDDDGAALLEAAGLDRARTLLVDSPDYPRATDRDAALPADAGDDPNATLLLLFTSGSTGAPKAVVCSTGRLAAIGAANVFGLRRDDVSYNAMPLFHGNALMAAWAPTLAVGGTFAMRRRFSASGFLPDVQRFGATFFNYVGRTIAYILAQPERAEERDNALRFGFGTEAAPVDRVEFERRYGCPLIESYGSSEGGLSIVRTADTPPLALGRAPAGTDVAVLDPDDGRECATAVLDAGGRLLNPVEAIGGIVNRSGAMSFEGYYNNAVATSERLRNGWYWTGDLGYRDADGFFYFAGRGADRLRVDGENIAAGPIERVLSSLPSVAAAAVYPVPDARTGDQVMAALELKPGATLDAVELAAFVRSHPDLGTKSAPSLVRITAEMPVTATGKIDKVRLRREAWLVDESVLLRVGTGRSLEYRALEADDVAALQADFAANGRGALWPSAELGDR